MWHLSAAYSTTPHVNVLEFVWVWLQESAQICCQSFDMLFDGSHHDMQCFLCSMWSVVGIPGFHPMGSRSSSSMGTFSFLWVDSCYAVTLLYIIGQFKLDINPVLTLLCADLPSLTLMYCWNQQVFVSFICKWTENKYVRWSLISWSYQSISIIENWIFLLYFDPFWWIYVALHHFGL